MAIFIYFGPTINNVLHANTYIKIKIYINTDSKI